MDPNPTHSPLVRCGVEEPLDRELHLYALNEATGISGLGFGEPVPPSLNRYSFLWGNDLTGNSEANSHRVVDFLWEQTLPPLRPAFAVALWSIAEDGQPPYKTLTQGFIDNRFIPQKTQEGWAIHHDDGITGAVKPVDSSTHFADWKHTLLVFGADDPLEFLLGPDTRAVTRRFSITGHMAPNNRFVDALARRNVTLGYGAREPIPEFPLVFISPHQLPIAELWDAGLIDTVSYGKDAIKLWRWNALR